MSSSITSKFKVRGVCAFVCGAAVMILAWTTWGTAALAQNEVSIKAGLTAWRSSGCSDCHGAFANGEKERDESPTGADIRRSRLSADELKLTIRCGRPGTGMPSFEESGMNYARPLIAAVAFGFSAGTAFAQGPQLPAGPNRDFVSRTCGSCHDLAMVVSAAGLSRDGWNATIDEMVSYGLRVTPDERVMLLDYFASALGSPSQRP